MWLSAVAINMETPRFREPVEPYLILLAACMAFVLIVMRLFKVSLSEIAR